MIRKNEPLTPSPMDHEVLEEIKYIRSRSQFSDFFENI